MDYRLRPSAAAVWVICHAMISLSAGLVESDEDPTVREEGTACHWAAYSAALGTRPGEGVTAPNGVPIDSDMLDAVDLYLSHVADWCDPSVTRYFEQPVHCAGIHSQCGGTPDVFAWDASTGTLYIGDLKYGYRFVDAVGNWQLTCYVDGVMRYFYLRPDDVKRVRLSIVQPRGYDRGGSVRYVEMTMADFAEPWGMLQAAAAAVFGPNPMAVTNRGCLNCVASARCQAAQDAALQVLDVTHDATPHDLPFAAAEDQLRKLQWAEGIVKARIAGLEAQVLHGMRAGSRSRHFAVEHKAGRRHWTPGSEHQIMAIAETLKANIKKDALITPTQAKRLLPAYFIDKFSQRLTGSAQLVPVEKAAITKQIRKSHG